jgi:tyrosine-protein kinase Etk/Wzc
MYSTKNNNNTEESGNIIQQLLFRYLPYWPMFVALLVLSLTAGWLYMRYTLPVYEANATLLVKDEKKGIEDSKLLESLNLYGSKKIVENEIEVLRSKSLVKQVIKNLSLYAPVYAEGRLIDAPGYIISPVKIEVKNPDSIIDKSKLHFSSDLAKKTVTVEGRTYPVGEWVNTPWGTLKFTKNEKYTAPKQQKPLYFSLINVKASESDLRSRLKVTPASKMATVINLNFKDHVPARAEDILNELLKVYNKASIEDKNRFASNTMSFVEDRLRYVVSELQNVESAIQKYKTEKNIVDISEQGKLFLSSVGANDQKISEINVQLAVLKSVEDYVQAKNEKSGIVPSTMGLNDPVLNGLLEKLYAAEVQYERVRKTTAENNPMAVSMRNEIEKMRPGIMENIQNQKMSLEAGKKDLNATSGRYLSALRTIPGKEKELLEISREQSIKNSIYTFLLQKREETALSYASTVADSRIVDGGESSIHPVSPKKMIVYLAAAFLAIAIGIALLSIKEAFNKTILYRQDIESLTPYPIIGEIMQNASKETLVVTNGKRSLIAEQFRQLRTSLAYLGIHAKKKRILITSSISGEGKSFISSNLAATLALTGKKVVILGLDLRKPKLNEAFNISNKTGLTNYLIGEMEAEEIIHKCEGYETLYVIPSGPTPPNPSELILNGRIQKLLHHLGNDFDYILIDTAPVSPVTDAYILAQYCDSVLYVVRHGVTPKIYMKMLEDNVKLREIKNLAIIFNGVKPRGMGEYGYGGYGYTQNYGYILDDDNEKEKKKGVSFFKRVISSLF